MAKKLITKGVDSSVLVKNLNSEMINSFDSNDLIGRKTNDSRNTDIGYVVELKEIDLNAPQLIYFKIEGHCRYISPAYVLGEFYYYATNKKFIDAHINNVSGTFIDKAVVYIEDGIFKIYLHKSTTFDINLRMYVYDERYHKDLIENIKLIRTEEDIPDFGDNFREMSLKYNTENNTGKVFDHIDLPATVSTLDLNTLPPIANVSTIILRYNGVVQDLDTYVSQVEEPIMPLPMNDEVEVSAETPSTLELNPGIAPMVNLDDYVGTPNNWLKIYVPNNYVYQYVAKYPSLKSYIYPINNLNYSCNYDSGVNLFALTQIKNAKVSDGTYDINFKDYSIDITKWGKDSTSLNVVRFALSTNTTLSTGDFVISGKISSDIPCKVFFDLCDIPVYSQNNQYIDVTTQPKDFIYYFRGYTKNSTSRFLDLNLLDGDSFEVKPKVHLQYVKFEYGKNPTSWSLAPEDINAQFDEVYEDINSRVDEVYEDIDATYAKKDGAYEGLLAGTALNLQGQHDVINNSMYRPTAGTLDINWEAAEIEGIQGNSIAWNQLVKNGNFTSNTGWHLNLGATLSVENNIGTFDITNDNSQYRNCSHVVSNIIEGHKYAAVIEANADGEFRIEWLVNGSQVTSKYDKINTWKRFVLLKDAGTPASYNRNEIGFLGSSANIIKLKNAQAFDLTLIYGRGNEPTTTEQFEEDYQRWFGKNLEYEEYDEGSIRNVQATGLKTVGFNLAQLTEYEGQATDWARKILFKNDCGYKGQINVKFDYTSIPLNEDKKVKPDIYIYYKDGTYNIIGGDYTYNYGSVEGISLKNKIVDRIIGMHNQSGILVVKNICVNFVWSGTRNGEYEEHWEETRSLPLTTLTGKLNGEGESVVVFPDGMKRADGAYDEIKVENGVTKAIKRVGSVDLGTLTYIKYPKGEHGFYFTANKVPFTAANNNALISKKYSLVDKFGDPLWNSDKSYTLVHNTEQGVEYFIIIDSSYTDIDEFKESLNGNICYYELAEPEVYIIDEFQLPLTYRVDDYGTEQVISPEGTVNPYLVTRYGVNAVDTIRRLPQNYISVKSLDDLLIKIGSYMQGTWTKTWNDITNSYDFSFLPNEVQDSSQPNEELPEI